MPKIQLIILIGEYAIKYYLKDTRKKNLTETVKYFQEYLPGCCHWHYCLIWKIPLIY